MGDLAARIAREHGFDFSRDFLGVTCKCGQDGFTVGHIVTVTEQAVVDRLEALARELDALTITHQAENYATVLRIKREGVMEAIRRLRGDADA